LLNHLTVKFALLFLVALWSFCRFYYFALYVIEHYVDPDYRFSGLFSFFEIPYRDKKAVGSGIATPIAYCLSVLWSWL
jgi:hypothetical protein